MRYVVFAGGTGIDTDRINRILTDEDHILCADEGAFNAMKTGRIPDRLIGDMDSIDPETLDWVFKNSIPTDVFPSEKDMTDSELCLAQIPENAIILFVLPLCGRFDYVFSNIMIAARYAREDRKIVLTDGRTRIYFVAGPDCLSLDIIEGKEWIGAEDLILSVIPILGPAENIRASGLYYPIDGLTLIPGVSRGVSNRPREGERVVSLTLSSGVIMVTVNSENYSINP